MKNTRKKTDVRPVTEAERIANKRYSIARIFASHVKDSVSDYFKEIQSRTPNAQHRARRYYFNSIGLHYVDIIRELERDGGSSELLWPNVNTALDQLFCACHPKVSMDTILRVKAKLSEISILKEGE